METQHGAVLLVWGNVEASNADLSGLNDWWTNEHLPERLSIPGFRRASRYLGQHKEINGFNYLTMYDVESLSTLTSNSYMQKLNNPTEGTKTHLPTLARLNRAACKTLSARRRPELESCAVFGGNSLLLTVNFKADDEGISQLTQIMREWFDRITVDDTAVLQYRLLIEDQQATASGSNSKSYQGTELASAKDSGDRRLLVFLESTNGLEQHGEALKDVMRAAGSNFNHLDTHCDALMCSAGKA